MAPAHEHPRGLGVVVATTTAGTALADLLDRSLGIGDLGGSALLLAALLGTP